MSTKNLIKKQNIEIGIEKSSGKLNVSLSTVLPKNALMGVPLNHVYNQGSSFKSNLEQYMTESPFTSGQQEGVAYYLDENNFEHVFKEYFYYLDEDKNKVYLDVSRSDISITEEGALTYGDKTVYNEIQTKNGLKASIEMKDYKDVELFEQRTDEVKECEENIKAYKRTLKGYVIVEKATGARVASLAENPSKDDVERFLDKIENDDNILLQQGDQTTYKMLVAEKNRLTVEYNLANTTVAEKTSIEEQQASVQERLSLYVSQQSVILEQLNQYYKGLVELSRKLQNLTMNTPVKFIYNEDVIMGFIKAGLPCVIMDKKKNYVAIERQTYYNQVSRLFPYRISRLYDKDENQITFHYTPSSKIDYIVDKFGNRTSFTYNGDLLTGIEREGKETFSISYDESNKITNVEDVENGERYVISYESDKVSKINIEFISLDDQGEKVYTNISEKEINISYTIDDQTQKNTEILIQTPYGKEKTKYNDDYDVTEFVVETDGVVTQAEKYTYAYNEKEIISAKTTTFADEDGLMINPITTYTFTGGVTETVTFDQYNNPARKTTSLKKVAVSSNGTTKMSEETVYTYNEAQKLVKEETTYTYVVVNGETETPYKTVVGVKEYAYNPYGDVVKTVSYVKGEEAVNGKNVNETVYDDNGNVLKTITYNTLDSASKFYSENIIDKDTGKVLSKLDGTGENKTEYIYDDKNNVIGEKLPNGATLSYGLDETYGVTSVTKSTLDGVENSTQKEYQNGLLKKVVSADTTIEYEYDTKRKVNSIKVNGNNYLNFTHSDIVGSNGKALEKTTTSNANGETAEVTKSKSDGKVTTCRFGDDTANFTYDNKDRLTRASLVMMEVPPRTKNFTYNEVDQVVAYEEKEMETVKVSETITYNKDGLIQNRSLVLPNDGQGYGYIYSDDSTKTLTSISSSELTIYPKYDKLKRNKGKKITCYGSTLIDEDLTYKKVGDHTTMLPSVLRRSLYSAHSNTLSSSSSIKYEYDNMGNIIGVLENGIRTLRYEYDTLGRLVREDNKALNKTTVFEYDNNGNILCKKEYAFTLKTGADFEELTPTVKNYVYQNGRLVSYNNQAISYDAMGLPTTYKDKTLTWSNGKLKSYDNNTFIYDTLGRRLKKNNYDCYYDSEGKLIRYRDMQFIYDETGIVGFHELGVTYAFVKDVQGNVIKLLSPFGDLIANYIYDAWGNCKVVNNSGQEITSDESEGVRNPIRYRGYFYDVETGLYYLKSRYYDPETGRFLSPDSLEYADPDSINGLNLYCYCLNNPISHVDPSGHSMVAMLIGLAISWAVSSIASYYLGEHLVSGVSSIYGGVQTIATGVSLLAYGPVGWVLGAAAIVVGAVNIAFGSAEIQQHFTGNNWINDIGITGGLYTGLYVGSSIASAAISIGGAYYKTTAHGQRAFALQNVKNFGYTDSVSKHMMDSSYFGKKYGSSGITTKGGREIRPYTNSLWAQKTIIKHGTMTLDDFGWVFTYDGYRLGINNVKRLIWHFGQGF